MMDEKIDLVFAIMWLVLSIAGVIKLIVSYDEIVMTLVIISFYISILNYRVFRLSKLKRKENKK